MEDRILNLVLAGPEGATESGVPAAAAGAASLELAGYEVGVASGAGAPPLTPVQVSRAEPTESVFILDLGHEEAMLVAGSEIRRLPRGSGGADLLRRAAAGAAIWRRERVRVQRRLELPDQLISFADRLNHAETPQDVSDALGEYAKRIVGGYTSFVFTGGRTGEPLQAVHTSFRHDARKVVLPALPRFSRPGLITAADARPDTGGPFSALAPLFADLQAAMIAHVPFGDEGVLFLIERRGERVFDAEDWDLLRTLTGQASSALERVRLFNEVRDLSLTDPLTGLANRRRLKVVLEHSLAAARRGEELAVVMLDLDGFKAINDEHGHIAGDQLLCSVAEYLRQEARGSDLVVRYGGDEFLVVLPGGNAAGAAALLQRLRERLGGRVEVSAGIAEYLPGTTSADDLIEAADRDLYAHKRGQGTPKRGQVPQKRPGGLMPPADE
jgi:diguanylate cyclase (GGDEF)-like protein